MSRSRVTRPCLTRNGYRSWKGDYGKADLLHERSLAIREKTLDPEHPHVGQSLNGLAELSRAQVRVEQQKTLCSIRLVARDTRKKGLWMQSIRMWPSRSSTERSSIELR